MKYFIGEERQPLSLEKYLSFGEEGNVYREGKEAIKIYYSSWEKSNHGYLDEENALRMTKISSRQILLPRRLVYDEKDEFCGYSTTYIRSFYSDNEYVLNYKKERQSIDGMSLYFLKKKIGMIYTEARYLSDKGILLEDLLFPTSNYIYNGQFWLIDPGCYTFSDEDPNKIFEHNIRKLNRFFISNCLLLGEEFFEENGIIEEKGPTYTVCDFIRDNEKPREKTLQFRNRYKKTGN